MTQSRDQILNSIRATLASASRAPLNSAARMTPRALGNPNVEIDYLLAEIERLSGVARRVANQDELRIALRELVEKEKIAKATTWATAELRELGIAEMLTTLGVEIVSQNASARAIAQCDLGITGVDFALPETGTLVLRTTPAQSRLVSLLPRVHLAILHRDALRGDLHDVFAEIKHDQRTVLITGPSRTTDIEKVLTIGVHGPKALHVWCVD
jgi:L-lactate dehydrogenase complex protein LldG